jgi:uncharacterized protein YkwD
MFTPVRRLLPLLLSGLLLVPLAGPVAADDPGGTDQTTPPPVLPDQAWLTQAGFDLVTLANSKRTHVGLVPLRMDPTLMSIARDRARVMAENQIMSHTEPDGTKVWDRINEAGITWYAGGEIIAWNHYPLQYSPAEAIAAWWASPGHHSIMVSTGYNYFGFGAAVSTDGKLYYAGVYLKMPDHTAPRARFTRVSSYVVDARHRRVTVYWGGGDVRLQTLTAGLFRFQVQFHQVNHPWQRWTTTTGHRKAITLVRGAHYEFRIHALDARGNWSPWQTIGITG